jgi:hypothetical protein
MRTSFACQPSCSVLTSLHQLQNTVSTNQPTPRSTPPPVKKVPGLGLRLDTSRLDLQYQQAYNAPDLPDAYERLLLDVVQVGGVGVCAACAACAACSALDHSGLQGGGHRGERMRGRCWTLPNPQPPNPPAPPPKQGDKRLFIRADELEAAWNLYTPLLHALERNKVAPELYPYGSRGPVGAHYLAAKYGVRWVRLEAFGIEALGLGWAGSHFGLNLQPTHPEHPPTQPNLPLAASTPPGGVTWQTMRTSDGWSGRWLRTSQQQHREFTLVLVLAVCACV